MSEPQTLRLVGAVLLAALIASLTGFISDQLVHPNEPEQLAYAIADVEAAPAATGGTTTAPAGPDPITALLTSADLESGKRMSRACAACHSFDKGGPTKLGPNLWNVVGRPVASVEGFGYSDGMAARRGVWDYDALNVFLYRPKALVPDTDMNFGGVKTDQTRADLVAWLRTLSDEPAPLP